MLRTTMILLAAAAMATPALAQTTNRTSLSGMTCADYAALSTTDRLSTIQGYSGAMQAEGGNRGQAGASTPGSDPSAAEQEDRALMNRIDQACVGNDTMMVTEAAGVTIAQ
jgi:hypothetical protein